MSNIDERISGALSADDRDFLASLDHDRGMFQQIGDTLNGPLRGWARLIFAISFVLGIAMAFAAWQLYHTVELRETILWSVGLLAMLIAQGFIKEWFYNRMNMFQILRELKRLEVQLSLKHEE